ncbi:hypothetical protein BN946_scf184940.g46 [Trametes cinnabarina]|uniref:EGF-like domain-containing protein n=1 Tax=Pycnoporus cinnabarinus TaxID=5643 RepID=A0A060SI58_PYCCI|nr:hypothetical protein BN946_scf184940.g46 [Trametes cinnabarina]
MLSGILTTSFLFGAAFAAQSSPTVVCVAGQCLEGYTNATIGATLSASGAATSLLLLPGQYTSTTNPALLHNLLTSSSASLSLSPGFDGNTSLPLNLALQPGVAVYPQANYSGQATFTKLPSTSSNSTAKISPGSLALASNVWIAVSGSSSDRVIFWDSVPDVSQLPSGVSGLSQLLDIQSSACSPPCAGAGVCSASGTCTCPAGFNGTSCETCAPGFFGPTCQACPADCTSCDDGMTGTGRCLQLAIKNAPSTCNCLNGVCNSDGTCACNAGWTTGANGTSCAKCATGFFLNSDGNCEVCGLGCTQCADGNGECISCKSGFTQNANDNTQCFAAQATTSTGTVCPDGSFSNGTSCQPCSPLCQTCSGPTSSDCIICGAGKYSLNGSCVGTDGNGVCAGSSLVADNNKHECDTCPSKCTTCKYSSFNVASTIDQVQCTGCLPGFVLSQGKCVESCPSGTFLNPQDNVTCTACVGREVLRGGTCVSANCNGTSSVISGLGICLSDLVEVPPPSGTSSKSPLPSVTGIDTPISSSPSSNTTVVKRPLQWWEILLMALGCAFIFILFLMCWRRRMRKRRAAATANFAAAKNLDHTKSWRYRLVRFGERLFGHKKGQRWMMPPPEHEDVRLEKLRAAEEARYDRDLEKLQDPRRESSLRHDREMDKLIGSYEYSRAGSSRAPSPLPSLRDYDGDRHSYKDSKGSDYSDRARDRVTNDLVAEESLYSQVTGQPRRAPEPRQPVRNARDLLPSRFSNATTYSNWLTPDPPAPPAVPVYTTPTPAQEYARSVFQPVQSESPPQRGAYWLQPANTGGSRNPFLR